MADGMAAVDGFAARVVGRFNAAARSAGPGMEPLAGVGWVAFAAAVVQAIVTGCDAFNPGWRGKLLGGRRPAPPDPAALRMRAAIALAPGRAPLLVRIRARQDRAAVLEYVRVARETFGPAGYGRIDADAFADAILAEGAAATDAEYLAVMEACR